MTADRAAGLENRTVVNPDSKQIAVAADSSHSVGGPLHGSPFGAEHAQGWTYVKSGGPLSDFKSVASEALVLRRAC